MIKYCYFLFSAVITDPKEIDLNFLVRTQESFFESSFFVQTNSRHNFALTHNSSCCDSGIFLTALACTECTTNIGYWNLRMEKPFSSKTDDRFWSLFNVLLPTVFHFRMQHYHTKKKPCSVHGVAEWTCVPQNPLLSALNWALPAMFDSWIINTVSCEVFISFGKSCLKSTAHLKYLSLINIYLKSFAWIN